MYVIYVISQRHLYRLLECGPCVVIGDRDKSDNTPAAALATAHILHMKLQNSRNSNIWNFNTITLYGDVDIISISFTISPFKKKYYIVYARSLSFHSHAYTYTHTDMYTFYFGLHFLYTAVQYWLFNSKSKDYLHAWMHRKAHKHKNRYVPFKIWKELGCKEIHTLTHTCTRIKVSETATSLQNTAQKKRTIKLWKKNPCTHTYRQMLGMYFVYDRF